jgi:DNA repair protein RecO (recombination protein O)
MRLAGLSAACAMTEATMPEREPHQGAYDGLAALLSNLGEEQWPSLYAHWELGLLRELGYSLDLSSCAATGRTDDLAYVSPRSGRAVGREAGEPYRDRLLPLPSFLLDRSFGSRPAVVAALALTGFFFEHHVLGPHGRSLPPARSRLVDRLQA